MSASTELAEVIGRLLALKRLPRTGWLQRGLTNVESIADHSYAVALLALLCSDLLADLDREKLLRIALLHDAAEALTGDIPASVRPLLGAEAKRNLEQRAFDALFSGLAAGSSYRLLWQEYTEASSREARVVKVLDRIELMAQALNYELIGVRTLDSFWPENDDYAAEFPLLLQLSAELRARRPAI
jgi:putative hydrolase of HD superfamily